MFPSAPFPYNICRARQSLASPLSWAFSVFGARKTIRGIGRLTISYAWLEFHLPKSPVSWLIEVVSPVGSSRSPVVSVLMAYASRQCYGSSPSGVQCLLQTRLRLRTSLLEAQTWCGHRLITQNSMLHDYVGVTRPGGRNWSQHHGGASLGRVFFCVLFCGQKNTRSCSRLHLTQVLRLTLR